MYFIFFIITLVLYFNLRGKISRLEEQIKLGAGVKNDATKPLVAQTESKPQPASVSVQEPAYIPDEIPIIHKQPVAPHESKPTDSLEYKFGSKIFTAVGAIAVLIGLAFFLSYAFQAGIITETMRVVLGVIAGIVLIGVGYITRNKYPQYGQILIGTGLGVQYLSLFSAYNFYNLIDLPSALLGMVAVTAIGVAASILLDSKPLAAFAGIGGFLTPFLLSYTSGNPHLLFSYILVLDLGLVALSFYKLWRQIALGSFVGTYIVFIAWFAQSYQESLWLVAEVYLSLFFIGFLAVSLLHYARQKAIEDENDLGLLSLNAGLYFLLSYILIDQNASNWMGLFTVVLGLIYLVIWIAVRERSDRDMRFRSFLAGISFTFFIIAVPIQFERFMITIVWAAQALVLSYLAVQIKSPKLRYLSQTLFMIVFVKLLFLDSTIAVTDPFINTRFITFAICLICFVASFIVHYLNPEKITDDTTITNIMMFQGAVLFVAGLSFDLSRFFEPSVMTVFWLIAVGIIGLAAFTTRNIVGRITALSLLGIALIRILTVHADLSDTALAFFNIRSGLLFLALVISLGIYYLYTTGLSQQERAGERSYSLTILTIEMYIVLQFLISFEIADFFKQYWMPVAWSVIAVGSFYLAMKLKNVVLRMCVYVTLTIATLRVLFFDSILKASDYSFVFNGRVLAFIVVAGALFIVAYILYKQPEGAIYPEERDSIVPLFGVVGNILLVWVLSKEVLDFFNQQNTLNLSREEFSTLESTKRVALSISWLFYAFILMGISIAKRLKVGRIMAIILIGMTVFKIFLYDTAQLDNFYRFVSYFSLGVLLLVTGFLYNKFKNIIIQFIQ